jgi:hypothetical protein
MFSNAPDDVKGYLNVVILVAVIVVTIVLRKNVRRKSRRPSHVATRKPFPATSRLKTTNVKFLVKASWNVVTHAVEIAMSVSKEESTCLVNIPVAVR